jgi:SAM-dependent methyltransferase
MSFSLRFPDSLSHLEQPPYEICKVNLDSLYVRVVSRKNLKGVTHNIIKLSQAPHYQYLQGNEHVYSHYLEKFGKDVGYGIEHSVKAYDDLIASPERYLEGKYSSDYIICEEIKTFWGSRYVILDGVHRASVLKREGVGTIPIALLKDVSTGPQGQFERYLSDYRDDFQEWYTPVSVGGKVIHERTYPDFRERPEFLNNRERGKSKWDYIIEKNLPPLEGKRVCDVGCNVGLFSILLRERGASVVHGYDRGMETVQPSNPSLPRQNVVQQAYFVRNLFCLAGRNGLEGIEYFEGDIDEIKFSRFNYDLFFSCCVLYHFGERFDDIIRDISPQIPEVFLQTNLGHEDPLLSKFASIDFHKSLLQKYGYHVSVDSPPGYMYPVIFGRK